MFEAFAGCDLILHAGDVGDLAVLERLGRVAPVVAVQGNDEVGDAKRVLPLTGIVDVDGVRVMVTHGHFLDPEEDALSRGLEDWPSILDVRRRMVEGTGADVLVFGHLHVPFAVERDGVLLVNPGIVGQTHVLHRSRLTTVALLEGLRVTHIDVHTGERVDVTLDLDEPYWTTHDRIHVPILGPEFTAHWRDVWRSLREVARNPTWNALLSCAQRCWTGDAEWITADGLLAEFAKDGPETAKACEPVLRALTRG